MFSKDLIEEVDDLLSSKKSGDSDSIVIEHFGKVLTHVHQSDIIIERVYFPDKQQYMFNLFFLMFSEFFKLFVHYILLNSCYNDL